MDHKQIFSSISERDIDLLILEELTVNESFSKWFILSVFGEQITPKDVKAWHSLSESGLGESDLIVTFQNGETEKFAILIENKIDAILQPQQPERYGLRGKKGQAAGHWSQFRTCLISPLSYFEANDLSGAFDSFISYENMRIQISELAIERIRGKFRAQIIAEAIEKNRRGYIALPDPVVTKFWSEYWQVAREFAPELKMHRPDSKPVNSDWPKFWPSGLPENSYIVHKMAQGFVDIEMRGAAERIDAIKSSIKGVFPATVIVKEAGKSVVIRVEVPPINRLEPIETQRENIKTGLRAAVMLMQGAQKVHFPKAA